MRWRTLVAGVLVLLLPLWDGGGSGGAGGELCGGWTDGGPDGAFYCPGLLDGADAKFCCGTCGAPYCCSSEAARLQHTQSAPSLVGSRAE
ncbi:protein shisa-3-like isoform X2 [Hemicordylus capensis]|uniref:protein shisa-3-like isoform X2 n=1 Tax=Hemicordylus capensis TaxID=884348 RepID=UPI002304C40B|nr:protein shisa-3-like isoform X2 [Hemicordylus capensis]